MLVINRKWERASSGFYVRTHTILTQDTVGGGGGYCGCGDEVVGEFTTCFEEVKHELNAILRKFRTNYIYIKNDSGMKNTN